MKEGHQIPSPRHVSRRVFLRGLSAAGGIAVVGALAACGVPTATPPTAAPAKPAEAPKPTAAPAAPAPAPAPAAPAAAPAAASPAAQAAPAKVVGSGFNWQRFKGETIRFIWTDNDPTVAGILPYWGEFEELTGMKLQYEGLPTAQFRQKTGIELVAKEASLDCYGMQVSQQGRQHFENSWIHPLDKFVEDKELTHPEWDLQDFGAGARSAQLIPSPGATPNAVTLLTAQTQVFYYRTDLFQAAGLQPPKTVQEMEEAAKALHKPDQQQYGVVLRGAGKWATTQIGTYLYGFGGKWIGEDGRLAIDTPEMGKTLEFYGGLLRKYGPPGASNIGERENPAILQQGQAAMMTELNHWKLILNDPNRSPKVAGKIATSLIPRGPVEGPVPGGHFMMLPVQNAAISPFSRHKEATWFFIQWLTNKKNFVRRQLKGNSSPRISTWQDPEFLNTPEAKGNQDWIDVTLNGIKFGRNWVSPPILAVDEFRDILAKAIDAAVLGDPPLETALKDVQQEADALLERTEPKDRKLEDWSNLKLS